MNMKKKFEKDKEKMEEVQRWRQALSQVGNLAGWDIGDKSEYEEIEEIVRNIRKRLPHLVSFPSFRNDDLVGIESPVEELEIFMLLDSVDVMSLGICGMAGMGKTTLATTLCQRIHHYFEFNYFVHDVSRICEKLNIQRLQKYLLGQDPEGNSLLLEGDYNVSSQTNSVSNGRRLIVLDNVGHIEHLEKLNLDHKFLSSGSRIVTICKDKRILEDYVVDRIYHVRPLNLDNANQLFCKYAFRGNCVMSEYEMLKYDVLSYLEGHPLLVKVLGRHLADQDVSKWRNALVKLRENPRKDILDKLRISFDGLEQNEKEIFLDIACLFSDFYGSHIEDIVMEVLQFRGFEPESGLKSLLNKSLITYYDETQVVMPSLLIDLGKYIVKEKSPKEPSEWTRLWDSLDLLEVLEDNKAPKNLEAIKVDCFDNNFPETMKADTIAKMNQLELLVLDGLKCPGSLGDLSNKLGYLFWMEYPFRCLPPNFLPNNLVRLVMPCSSIQRLWKGKKALPNLKHLDLSFSNNLVKMPNFEEAPNLERLKFEGCIQLRKIHSSISVLRKLTFLNLNDCTSLVKIPDFGEALNLKSVDFEGCIELRKVHPSIGSLRELTSLNLRGCKNLVSLPTSVLSLRSLEHLNLSGCSNLYNTWSLEEPWLAKHLYKPCIREAPIHSQSTSSFEEKSFMPSEDNCLLLSPPSFPCMRYLDLSFCNLHQIPDAIGNLCCLELLKLMGNNFEKMPSLKKLSKLAYLNLEHCKQLKYLFELPSEADLIDVISTVYDRGLYMLNCPQFVGSEEWSRMSISWMIEMIKADHADYHKRKSLNHDLVAIDLMGFGPVASVYPGNKIPRWFKNQRVGIGNTICVDGTSLRQDDNSWIGVGICVVLCMSHHQNNLVIKRSLPKTKTGLHYSVPVLLDVDPITDMSDYMYLRYFCRPKSIPYVENSDGLELYFETTVPDCHWEVKKYGYRLVYESNIVSKHCKNSSNPKRKFLEIKQKQ